MVRGKALYKRLPESAAAEEPVKQEEWRTITAYFVVHLHSVDGAELALHRVLGPRAGSGCDPSQEEERLCGNSRAVRHSPDPFRDARASA
jgi:hypothetical protein